MRLILGIVGAALGAMIGDEVGLVVGFALGVLVGWVIMRERRRADFLAARPLSAPATPTLTEELDALKSRVASLEREVARLKTAEHSTKTDATAPAQAAVQAEEGPPPQTPSEIFARETRDTQEVAAPYVPPSSPEPSPDVQPVSRPTSPTTPSAEERAIAAIKAFLFGGNTVVRIGILILTVGVGLLVKYAADHAYFPVELRLAFAAALGIALIVLGYKLRARGGFGTALSGGGVAALYLVTFFAYYAYHLIPATLTTILLVAIALSSSMLAIAQQAEELAVFGAIGGFLAPVLASRDGGSHVALFSFYALLNAQITGTALFRSWRFLNLTGFVFTFGIATAWGALRYEPDHMASASGFLALFFVFFLIDGMLFALKRRGTIDSTLTFGTPLATLALAIGLFHSETLILAFACVAVSAAYLAAARFLLARKDDALGPLAQAYLAIGVGVGTLAIPFGLSDALATALAWTVEASGLVWVGLRQDRLRARVFGYVLYLAALAALLVKAGDASDGVRASFFTLVALGFLFGAAHVDRRRKLLHASERGTGHVLLGVALLLYRAAIHYLTAPSLTPFIVHDLALLTIAAASVFALDVFGERCDVPSTRIVARFALPYFLLSLPPAFDSVTHPFAGFAFIGWLLALASAYLVLHRQREALDARASLRDGLHASGGVLVAGLLVSESIGLSDHVLHLSEGFAGALILLGPLAVCVAALCEAPRWPVGAYPRAYRRWTAFPLTLLVSIVLLFANCGSDGSTAPLPYAPLLNPLDLTSVAALVVLNALARTDQLRSAQTLRIAAVVTGISVLVGASGTVVRTAHHWADIPFVPFAIPKAPAVQAAFSILWTSIALVAMLIANRRARRGLWMAGAGLLGLVVVKLFASDLDTLGGVAKIVTFLAVGLLLLLIGYVAPVPPKSTEHSA